MRKMFILLALPVIFSGCKKKLEDLEANNVPFDETYVGIEEILTIEVPNTAFSWGGFLNCTSLPFGATSDYEAFIPTQNPNPYAHLVDDIQALSVTMELTNITDCDFDMLQSVEIYLVDLADTCGNVISDASQIVLPDDGVTYYGNCSTALHEAGAYYNAVKLGDFSNFTSGIGHTIQLDLNPDARLDQFIHAQNFQTYAFMVFDKAFTQDKAILKTTMDMKAKLINSPDKAE